MVRFQNDWYAETVKFVDAQIKIAAAESAENAETLKAGWVQHYADSGSASPVAIGAIGARRCGCAGSGGWPRTIERRASKN